MKTNSKRMFFPILCGLCFIISWNTRAGEKKAVSLNGPWKITLTPSEKFYLEEDKCIKWQDVTVPGEVQMQGFPIKHDSPFVYFRKVVIPADFKDKLVYINFYGVYSQAKVWVNGQFAGEHVGGFTAWRCNITPFVKPGSEANLFVEVADRVDDISFASGYAKHQIGGILRDVELCAIPEQHFEKLWFKTKFDKLYRDAELTAEYELAQNSKATAKIRIYNAHDVLVLSSSHELNTKSGEIVIPVKNPLKWDAEHPNLYKIEVELLQNGKSLYTNSEKIGFREVRVEGNKLLVNGSQVKLRGACRHDIHPLLGRMTTADYDKMDVLLAKEANMNFIRTSHYPPSKKFLEYCDEFGLYVESETAVCFVGSHRTFMYRPSGASQNNPSYTGWYISQLEEMVDLNHNHPSVIIWSIGNENVFGTNFIESYKWVKLNDPSRPVIYSYPGQVPDSTSVYDIISMHYPDWRGNLEQYGIKSSGFESPEKPMLFDEWAHVACYNNSTLKRDPNVRNFWGQSLDSMWNLTYTADGALGGAIWCMIDETFMLPENLQGYNEWWGLLDPQVIPSVYMGHCVGYGEWGIVDTWRRKKPEFFLTKKAYSPVKLLLGTIEKFQTGKPMSIPVFNRFDHTNLNELTISWEYAGKKGKVENVNIGPRQKGNITVPSQLWKEGDIVKLAFFTSKSDLIDSYELRIGNETLHLPQPAAGNMKVIENAEKFMINGAGISLEVPKSDGIPENISLENVPLLKKGPFVRIKTLGNNTENIAEQYKKWKCTKVLCSKENGIITVNVAGNIDTLSVNFILKVDEKGLLQMEYFAEHFPANLYPEETGIGFITGDRFSKIAWDRKPYFSGYPGDHIGRAKGEASLIKSRGYKYRTNPAQNWEKDVVNFYYFGIDTTLRYSNLARSLKENIWQFALETPDKYSVNVVSDATQACRFDMVGDNNLLIINDYWDYPDLSWGNFTKQVKTTGKFRGKTSIIISHKK